MQLHHNPTTNQFYCLSSYPERNIPRTAGFRWDGNHRRWYTADPNIAAKLVNYATAETLTIIKGAAQARKAAIAASSATTANINIPVPDGLAYLPFQRAGIAYAIARAGCLIADEMGLGKTVQAIGVINATNPASVVIVVPASLKVNWTRELDRWLVTPRQIQVVKNGKEALDCDASIIIINYDLLAKFPGIVKRNWDLLIADEAHYAKNGKAARSKALYSIQAARKCFLTGTPILNRPAELYPAAKYLDFDVAHSWKAYHERFCNAYQTRYGWNISGASHLDELQERLRANGMVRRLKKDVLTDLPAKRRQIVTLEAGNGLNAAIAEEKAYLDRTQQEIDRLKKEAEAAKAAEDEEKYREAVEALGSSRGVAFTEMARMRHKTALAKVPAALERIIDTVEAAGKVVVFAHHHDVIDALHAALAGTGLKVVTLTGEMAADDRQASIDAFQVGNADVFIGSIKAAGTGLTLTSSSNVIFVELDWTPGVLSQAEDRVHRIGQAESVLVQHIVVDGSIDANMAKMLVDKQEIIDKALNTGCTAEADSNVELSIFDK